MTINIADNSPRVSYSVAQGVTQTSFTVSFEFFDNDDLNVYVDGTLKTLTTDYTVTGGDGSTGTVTISVTGASLSLSLNNLLCMKYFLADTWLLQYCCFVTSNLKDKKYR